MHGPRWMADRYNSLSDWFIPSNHLGKERADLESRLFFDFWKKFCYNNYRRNEKGEFSNDAESAGCHSGVLHEPRFLQELPSSVRKCHVNGNLILFRQDAAAPVWSRIFAQARSLEIKKQNG